MAQIITCILYMTEHLCNNRDIDKLIIDDNVMLWLMEFAPLKMYTKYERAPII